jgi:hypothetical protein
VVPQGNGMVMTFGHGWSGSRGGRPSRSWKTRGLLLGIASIDFVSSKLNQLAVLKYTLRSWLTELFDGGGGRLNCGSIMKELLKPR